jgi:hypothetical protein
MVEGSGDFLEAIVEDDLQAAAGGQIDAIAELTLGAETVEHARNGAGVLAEFCGLALEAINFFENFDGNYD